MLTTADRVSLFVSHKTDVHQRAAQLFKELLESHSERIDVQICENIEGGELWQPWVKERVESADVLLVLRPPPRDDARYLEQIEREIRLFETARPFGRIVVLQGSGKLLPQDRQRQVVNATEPDIAKHLLYPLYHSDSFFRAAPLNPRVNDATIQGEARQLESALRGCRENSTRLYSESMVVELGADRSDASQRRVLAPNRFEKILGCSRASMGWSELEALTDENKWKGTFWLQEIDSVIRSVVAGRTPPVMTSTLRGGNEAAGRIFQPQLEMVDFDDESPVRFSFSFHEVLVPELVRGPGAIGDVANLLHLVARVRWEVLQPFLVRLALQPDASKAIEEIPDDERSSIVAKVIGSLRTIDVEAKRHSMLDVDVAATFDFDQRQTVHDFLTEREAVHAAIELASQQDDFGQLMTELTRCLRLNCKASELLASRYLELWRKANDQALGLVEAHTDETGAFSTRTLARAGAGGEAERRAVGL
jgi:hypothetical protein